MAKKIKEAFGIRNSKPRKRRRLQNGGGVTDPKKKGASLQRVEPLELTEEEQLRFKLDNKIKFAVSPGGTALSGQAAEDMIIGRLSEIESQKQKQLGTTKLPPKIITTNRNLGTTTTRAATEKELPSLKQFKKKQQLLKTNLPKLQKGGVLKDIGNTLLNTAATPFEALSGNNFFDPEFTTGVGKGINKAQDTIGQVGSKVLPIAANLVVPGAGTAITAGRSLFGVEQGGFDDSFLSEGVANTLGTAASIGYKFLRKGGSVNSVFKRVYAGGGKVPIEVEGGEASARPDGSFVEFNGPGHDRGGIDVNEPEGSVIIPRSLKAPFDEAVKNGDKLRISSIKAEVLKREGDREIENAIDLSNKFQNGGGVDGELPGLNFGVTPSEIPFQEIQGVDVPGASEGVTGDGSSPLSVTGSQFGDTALSLGPGAFNLASGLLSKPEQVDPITNPFEQQALDKLKGRKINLDPVRRQIGESFSSAKRGIRNSGNISPGAFRSNISNLATQEAQSLADVELQEQQANLGFEGQEAQALLQVGEGRQRQQLIADQLSRQAKSAKKKQISQGIEGLQQGAFNLSQLKQLGKAFPFASS